MTGPPPIDPSAFLNYDLLSTATSSSSPSIASSVQASKLFPVASRAREGVLSNVHDVSGFLTAAYRPDEHASRHHESVGPTAEDSESYLYFFRPHMVYLVPVFDELFETTAATAAVTSPKVVGFVAAVVSWDALLSDLVASATTTTAEQDDEELIEIFCVVKSTCGDVLSYTLSSTGGVRALLYDLCSPAVLNIGMPHRLRLLFLPFLCNNFLHRRPFSASGIGTQRGTTKRWWKFLSTITICIPIRRRTSRDIAYTSCSCTIRRTNHLHRRRLRQHPPTILRLRMPPRARAQQ